VSQPATLTWFARHELRLFWRDTLSMLTSGKRGRESVLLVVGVVFAFLVHLIAYVIILPFSKAGIGPDKATLLIIAGTAFLSWALMLSQAIETVTRAFYARLDLDLILSSPASARRVFAVRMAAIALSSMVLATFLSGPLINVLAVLDGPRWLSGYGVLGAMGALSTALAIVVTAALFRAIGPKLTRLVSQIVSAVVAAAFVVGVQVAAIFSTGSFSRLSIFRSENVVALAPEPSSLIWWPAHAIMGDVAALTAVMGVSLGLLGFVIATFSTTFARHASAVTGVATQSPGKPRRYRGFRSGPPKRALRRKELILLRRDPWLLSQTLMQILYLLPPIVLLSLHFGDDTITLLVLVPVLVMAAGQLAGGLAWLAVLGEDAPDLVASAPILARAIFWAKIEAVLGSVFVIVAPLLIGLALAAPVFAVIAALGVVVAASSGTMIQFWFRGAARRVGLRRRQIPSRIATLAEALSSILWAGTAALAAAASPLATVTALVAVLVLAGIWMIRPRHENAA
jgi:ABC-2 type transport system permease protein